MSCARYNFLLQWCSPRINSWDDSTDFVELITFGQKYRHKLTICISLILSSVSGFCTDIFDSAWWITRPFHVNSKKNMFRTGSKRFVSIDRLNYCGAQLKVEKQRIGWKTTHFVFVPLKYCCANSRCAAKECVVQKRNQSPSYRFVNTRRMRRILWLQIKLILWLLKNHSWCSVQNWSNQWWFRLQNLDHSFKCSY